jgi:hypothetical protein
MTAFLRAKRREGRTMRWIAAHLGVTLGRAIAKAARLRLILHVPRTSVAAERLPGEPEPAGAVRELAGEGLCRWIEADPLDAWRMCAAPCVEGEAWCPHHKARVYVKEVPHA